MRADELIGGVSGVLLLVVVVRSSLGGGVAAPGGLAATGANVHQRQLSRGPQPGAIRCSGQKKVQSG